MTFSMVVPCYKVAAYLPDFLASLDVQAGRTDDIEVIFISDGCPEGSADVAGAWANPRGYRTQVVEKPNGGASSARNRGLTLVTGTWVTFPDPDDVLADNYLALVRRAVAAVGDDVHAIATRLVPFVDEPGAPSGRHALDYKFASGDRTVRLDDDPTMVQLSSASAFLRTSVLQASGLSFDERLRTTFEDAHLLARFFLHQTTPKLHIAASATYFYRRRPDASSATQLGASNYARYIDVMETAYLDVLSQDSNPAWLEYLVLYDIFWLFKAGVDAVSAVGTLTPEQNDRMVELATEVMGRISVDAVENFNIVYVHRDIRAAWGGLSGRIPRRPVRRLGPDATRTRRRLSYYSASPEPGEVVLVDGAEVRDVRSRTRGVRFFNRSLAFERLLVVPEGVDIRCLPPADGSAESFARDGIATPDVVLNEEGDLSARNAVFPVPDRRNGFVHKVGRYLRDPRKFARFAHWRWGMLLDVLARLWFGRSPGPRSFEDAWIIMDRDDLAGDNGEALYRYLRSDRPDINAWFVLSRRSVDWARLKREGFCLVAHSSRRHLVLTERASNVVSSHFNQFAVAPFPRARLRRHESNFAFLQHGIIKDDLSGWLNRVGMQLFITTTPDEYRSIVEDGSPYNVAPGVAEATGLPRHDRLLALKESTPDEQRNLLLIMPTWRNALLQPQRPREDGRALVDDFDSTPFARHWKGLLESAALQRVIRESDLDVVFLPHPNLASHLPDSWRIDGIHVASYSDPEQDIQSYFARCALAVTDYSSNGAEVAYLGSPVVYFQFDRDEIYNGAHGARQGYFDFERDGYGPVTTTVDSASEAIEEVVMRGEGVTQAHRRRIAEDFVTRDGRCCERVTDAIIARTPRSLSHDRQH